MRTQKRNKKDASHVVFLFSSTMSLNLSMSYLSLSLSRPHVSPPPFHSPLTNGHPLPLPGTRAVRRRQSNIPARCSSFSASQGMPGFLCCVGSYQTFLSLLLTTCCIPSFPPSLPPSLSTLPRNLTISQRNVGLPSFSFTWLCWSQSHMERAVRDSVLDFVSVYTEK